MIELKIDVPMEEVFQEVDELTKLHWEEIANNKEVIKLKPDKEKFITLQKAGILRNAFAFDEGKIVGYVVILLTPHLHYKDDLMAFVDVIYLHPEHRGGRLGIKLIEKAEELARERGASVITHHCKPHHQALEKIISRKGYKHSETIFSKLLKE